MIEGVVITPLKQIADERGKVMHMLRSDAPHFKSFGEIYFSTVNFDIVKAWHIHNEMTLNYAVIQGEIKFVLYDSRKESSTYGQTQEIFLGPDNYQLVTVPPLIWSGFKGLSTLPAMVANCASIPHDPNEIRRQDFDSNDIPYNWEVKQG